MGALLIDSTPLGSRARVQGNVDVLVALAGAGGGLMSGLVVTVTSYAVLALAGGVLALFLVPIVVWHRREPDPAAAPDSPPSLRTTGLR